MSDNRTNDHKLEHKLRCLALYELTKLYQNDMKDAKKVVYKVLGILDGFIGEDCSNTAYKPEATE